MPELPEVEIVRQSLNRQVKNRKIINIQVNNRNLRLKVPKDFEQIFKNAIIEKIQRKSKYLILFFQFCFMCYQFLLQQYMVKNLINMLFGKYYHF